MALILTLLTQTVTAVWWASGLSHTVEANSDRFAEMKVRVAQIDNAKDDIKERLITLESDVKYGNRILKQYIDEQRQRDRRRSFTPAPLPAPQPRDNRYQ